MEGQQQGMAWHVGQLPCTCACASSHLDILVDAQQEVGVGGGQEGVDLGCFLGPLLLDEVHVVGTRSLLLALRGVWVGGGWNGTQPHASPAIGCVGVCGG